ncbi:MAG: hypothetical protein P4N41_13105 [Negativicutes bacterium]|nr:hypothetical protein [Negativicutes bacterium]
MSDKKDRNVLNFRSKRPRTSQMEIESKAAEMDRIADTVALRIFHGEDVPENSISSTAGGLACLADRIRLLQEAAAVFAYGGGQGPLDETGIKIIIAFAEDTYRIAKRLEQGGELALGLVEGWKAGLDAFDAWLELKVPYDG